MGRRVEFTIKFTAVELLVCAEFIRIFSCGRHSEGLLVCRIYGIVSLLRARFTCPTVHV